MVANGLPKNGLSPIVITTLTDHGLRVDFNPPLVLAVHHEEEETDFTPIHRWSVSHVQDTGGTLTHVVADRPLNLGVEAKRAIHALMSRLHARPDRTHSVFAHWLNQYTTYTILPEITPEKREPVEVPIEYVEIADVVDVRLGYYLRFDPILRLKLCSNETECWVEGETDLGSYLGVMVRAKSVPDLAVALDTTILKLVESRNPILTAMFKSGRVRMHHATAPFAEIPWGAPAANVAYGLRLLDEEVRLRARIAPEAHEARRASTLRDAAMILAADKLYNLPDNARVRVVRVVEYEGSAGWLRKQIAQSSPTGVREVGRGDTLTITQGPLEVLPDLDRGANPPIPPDPWDRTAPR